MTREDIILQLTPIAREVFSDSGLIIHEKLTVADVPNWTSLTFMMLLTEIENHFNIKFKMMEILKMQDMQAIINTIQSHLI